MNAAELREQAARAERLAWAVCDATTTERLIAMSKEYRRHADALDAANRATETSPIAGGAVSRSGASTSNASPVP